MLEVCLPLKAEHLSIPTPIEEAQIMDFVPKGLLENIGIFFFYLFNN